MSELAGIAGRRHFSPDVEDALRRDEATSAVVKKATGTKEDIGGEDRTWVETKEHQGKVLENPLGIAEVGHVAIEGAEIAGVIHLGAAATIGSTVVGVALNLYGLHHAIENGKEQKSALAKDDAHVALLGALDLPAGYKQARLEGDYAHVAKGTRSPAFRATEALMKDEKARAVLQLHADRGMNAARDVAASGMSKEAFLAANPKVAASYSSDAAFHEGFDAYLHAKAHLPAAEMKALERALEARDGWYAQSQVQVRG